MVSRLVVEFSSHSQTSRGRAEGRWTGSVFLVPVLPPILPHPRRPTPDDSPTAQLFTGKGIQYLQQEPEYCDTDSRLGGNLLTQSWGSFWISFLWWSSTTAPQNPTEPLLRDLYRTRNAEKSQRFFRLSPTRGTSGGPALACQPRPRFWSFRTGSATRPPAAT